MRDGFAVSTGLKSNTENGAVVTAAVLRDPGALDALVDWLRKQAVPASVVVTVPPDPATIARLIERA